MIRFFVIAGILCFTSCAAWQSSGLPQSHQASSKNSLAPASNSEADLRAATHLEEESRTQNSLETEITQFSIDAQIQQTLKACDEKNYAQAHNLGKKAVGYLSTHTGEEDTLQIDEYYNVLVDMYARTMPPEYLDSMPEEISVMVFERRLAAAIDTVPLGAQDSARYLALENGKAAYDYPMIWNDRVLKSLSFLSKGRKGNMAVWLKRASPYIPYLQTCMADYGLPRDLAWLPLIESGFSLKAYSRAHASGMWQFIPSTGRVYGLRINYFLDERRDVIKSTHAAANYLRKLYTQFGDWHCAVASYNCGEGGLSRALARTDSLDYWKLRLPRETMSYVPQLIAALIVAKNPTSFGYEPLDTTRLPFDTLTIDQCVDMRTIASAIGTPVDSLRSLNPHILHWCTPPSGASTILYVPLGLRDTTAAFFTTLSPEEHISWYRYTTGKKETLSSLSKKFKIPEEAIRSVNGLRSDRIFSQQTILIPIPTVYAVKENGDTLVQVDSVQSIIDERIARTDMFASRHTVRKGENLGIIARKYHTTVAALQRLNPRVKSSRLSIGQKLIVRKSTVEYVAPSAPITLQPVVIKMRPSADSTIIYHAKNGDSLPRIARLFNVPVDSIKVRNNLTDSAVLAEGKTLIIPWQARILTDSTTPRTSQELNTPASENGASRVVYYKVRAGDTLWAIAQAFGVSVDSLYTVNQLARNASIKAGSTLKIIASN